MKKNMYYFLFLLCATPVFAQQYAEHKLKWDGVQRKYYEYVPASMSQQNPSPVIFCLHGLGADMWEPGNWGILEAFSDWVVVSPEALPGKFPDGSNAGNAWNSGASATIPGGVLNVNPNTDDPGFLMAILDSLQRNYYIRTDSVYFMGYSMGGFMSQKMAILHGDRIKGVASVSGCIGNEMKDIAPATNVNVLHIHGTDDPTVRYADAAYNIGGGYYSVGLGAEATVEYWRSHNQCSSTATVTNYPDTRSDGKTFQRSQYTNDANGSRVALIKVNKGKHEWYYTPQNDIDYATEIYRFFTNQQPAEVTKSELLLADFEGGSTFFTVETTNCKMALVANPDKSGENVSDYVLQINGGAARDNSWESLYTPNSKTTYAWELNATTGYRYLHYKVWKDFTSKMLSMFYHDHDNDDAITQAYANEVQNNTTGAWEYIVQDLLVFDGDGSTWHINSSFGAYYRMAFNMTKSADERAGKAYTAYIDDIYLSNSAEKILKADIPTHINAREATATNKATVLRLDGNTVQLRIHPEWQDVVKVEAYTIQGQLLCIVGAEQAAKETIELTLPAGNLYILRVSDRQGVYSVKFK